MNWPKTLNLEGASSLQPRFGYIRTGYPLFSVGRSKVAPPPPLFLPIITTNGCDHWSNLTFGLATGQFRPMGRVEPFYECV